jgi:hypothetical protein
MEPTAQLCTQKPKDLRGLTLSNMTARRTLEPDGLIKKTSSMGALHMVLIQIKMYKKYSKNNFKNLHKWAYFKQHTSFTSALQKKKW